MPSAPIPSQNATAVYGFYAALNANDIPTALSFFDKNLERIEPEGFPSSGTFHGLDAFKEILIQGRGSWAEGTCSPEELLEQGNKIVVLVHVKVRLQNKTEWIDARIADGFIVENGKIVFMRTFVKREDAVKWAEL